MFDFGHRRQKMPLVVEDDYVDIDTLIGPLPRFDSSFDKFFIEKAANLLFEPNSNDLIEQKVRNFQSLNEPPNFLRYSVQF